MKIKRFNEGIKGFLTGEKSIPSISSVFQKSKDDRDFLITMKKLWENKLVCIEGMEPFQATNFCVTNRLNEENDIKSAFTFIKKNGEQTPLIEVNVKIIFKPIKRIITPEDPYGEEDWDN